MTAVVKAFRTPASVHPLTPMTGRRPKNLNDSGRSAQTAGTALCAHSGHCPPHVFAASPDLRCCLCLVGCKLWVGDGGVIPIMQTQIRLVDFSLGRAMY